MKAKKFDFKYGIMVLDKRTLTEDGQIDMVHFVGVKSKPTQNDLDTLRKELSEDESFGLSKDIDNLVFSEAPVGVVKDFIKGANAKNEK